MQRDAVISAAEGAAFVDDIAAVTATPDVAVVAVAADDHIVAGAGLEDLACREADDAIVARRLLVLHQPVAQRRRRPQRAVVELDVLEAALEIRV